MEYFAGLDVAMKETAICVVDAEGKTVMEGKALSEPGAIADFLHPFREKLRRVGHEAGALSPWLQRGLIECDLKVVCLETIHVRSVLKAQRNKTDKNDARGLAQMMRTGWFREVHVKSDESYRLRLLLTHRRNLKRKFLDLENAIRHSLKVFGIKLHLTGRAHFEDAVREQVAHDPLLAGLCDAMLRARAALWVEYLKLHKLLVQFASRDPVCLRFMGIPGVGPVTALAFKTAIDDPTRFKRARIVGAHFGLTPKRYQSTAPSRRSAASSRRNAGPTSPSPAWSRRSNAEAATLGNTRKQPAPACNVRRVLTRNPSRKNPDQIASTHLTGFGADAVCDAVRRPASA